MSDLVKRHVSHLRRVHREVCYENGWDDMEEETAYSEGADALEAVGPLRKLVSAQAARIERLEAALISTAASLAASISLLRRGGESAAPSDKMFDQMLVDYEASLGETRDALKESQS